MSGDMYSDDPDTAWSHLVACSVKVEKRCDHQQVTHMEAGGGGVKPSVYHTRLGRLEKGN